MVMKGYKLPNEVPWNDIELGAIVTEPGSASFRKTGDWRTEHPYIDKGICIRCGLCWLPRCGYQSGRRGLLRGRPVSLQRLRHMRGHLPRQGHLDE